MQSWPQPGREASQIRSMWRRIRGFPVDDEVAPAQAEEKAGKSRDEADAAVAKTNGQVNGASIKSE